MRQSEMHNNNKLGGANQIDLYPTKSNLKTEDT